MTARGLGITLIWIGTLALVAVLQQRIRRGAWSEEKWDVPPPPIERWQVPVAAAGLVLALVGTGLMVWGEP